MRLQRALQRQPRAADARERGRRQLGRPRFFTPSRPAIWRSTTRTAHRPHRARRAWRRRSRGRYRSPGISVAGMAWGMGYDLCLIEMKGMADAMLRALFFAAIARDRRGAQAALPARRPRSATRGAGSVPAMRALDQARELSARCGVTLPKRQAPARPRAISSVGKSSTSTFVDQRGIVFDVDLPPAQIRAVRGGESHRTSRRSRDRCHTIARKGQATVKRSRGAHRARVCLVWAAPVSRTPELLCTDKEIRKLVVPVARTAD